MSSRPASTVVLLWPSRALVAASALAVAALLFAQPLPAHAQDTDKALDQCEDGVRAADAGRWEEAEFRWMKAMAIDRTVPCSYNNLAVMHEVSGRIDQARHYYRMALSFDRRHQPSREALQRLRAAKHPPRLPALRV